MVDKARLTGTTMQALRDVMAALGDAPLTVRPTHFIITPTQMRYFRMDHQAIAEHTLKRGIEHPYDRDDAATPRVRFPDDWAYQAARGVLFDLCDRRDIKVVLADVELAVREDMIDMLASVIRAASPAQHAIDLAVQYGQIDGDHHKAWVIDQMVRVLAGPNYAQVVTDAKAGEHGPDTYDWNEGIAP